MKDNPKERNNTALYKHAMIKNKEEHYIHQGRKTLKIKRDKK